MASKELSSFELVKVINGGWILTDRAGYDSDGRCRTIPATFAYSDTDDMMKGLAEMLYPKKLVLETNGTPLAGGISWVPDVDA